MRLRHQQLESAARRCFQLLLIALFAHCGNSLKAQDISELPIEVIEALEELIPSFDPSMIASADFDSKELIKVQCINGDQIYEASLTVEGELLWMRQSHPEQDKRPFLEIPAGVDIRINRLPLRISQVLRHRFPGIIIQKAQAVEQRNHRRRMFRVDAEHMDARLALVLDKHGNIVEFSLDSDSDGLCDVEEIVKGLDRRSEDTDGDGFPDGIENDFLGNPSDPSRIPTLLKLCHDCDTKVVVVTAQTFKGRDFVIEVSETGKPGDWVRLGESISGDGSPHDFTIPSDGPCRMTMFRLGITKEEGGGRVRKDGGADESGDCLVPVSLVGREITIGDGRRLFFNMRNRGQLIEETGKGMIVTQFSYTFKRSGHCKAKVVLTISAIAGFQTTVYNLTFTAEGDTGIFDASAYERGNIEDQFDGSFAITMNP
jgi:hypothetical protein